MVNFSIVRIERETKSEKEGLKRASGQNLAPSRDTTASVETVRFIRIMDRLSKDPMTAALTLLL